jgi:biopolymer transport protein ExbD
MAVESGISDGTGAYSGWPPELRKAGDEKHRRKRRHFARTPPISITSLTDMVTMLLVYLLSTFATNPVEVNDPSIEVPHSSCRPDETLPSDTLPPDGCGKIEETTIVMVTGPQVARTTETGVKIQQVVPRILVNGQPVTELDAATYRVPDAVKDPASGNYVIVPLREALKREKAVKEVTAQLSGKTFDGKVIILADRRTPYRVLTDVLVTCGESGFADFRFAVIRPE